jgi:protoporphyrinogen oxidase
MLQSRTLKQIVQARTSNHSTKSMSLPTTPKLRILISDTGITGPCLAYWLSKTRLATSITVLERSSVPRPTGQAIDIHGPAISIIEKMGLLPAVRACNTTEEGTRIANAKTGMVAEFGKGETFTAEYEIRRADLCGLFLDATESLPNVTCRYGNYVTSLQQDGKKVDVTYNSGTSETFDLTSAQTVTAPLSGPSSSTKKRERDAINSSASTSHTSASYAMTRTRNTGTSTTRPKV